MNNKIFTNCIHYRKGANHCAKNFYQYDCRDCMFFKNVESRITELENESNFWKEKYLNLQKDYLDLKSKFDSLQSQYDFEINKPIIQTNWDTYKSKTTQDCRFAPDVK